MPLTEQELNTLKETVGSQAKDQMKKEFDAYDAKVKTIAEEAVKTGGSITKDTFDAYKTAADTALNAVKDIAVKQGTTLEELQLKVNANVVGTKSIAEVLADDEKELRKIHSDRQGAKTYLLTFDRNGNALMKAIDMTSNKAAGPHASIAGVGGGGNVASISQALDSATLLRIGAGAMIQSQYRNTPWLFDLCNTISASFIPGSGFVLWFDEQAKDGASANVAEGATKPLVQYKYQLNSATYKKEAALVGFTDEFNIDFAQLQGDIMNKAQIDVINRVNASILPNIKTAATAYSTAAAFQGGTAIPSANDFDAIAAMAAQVDNATFGARANSAIMSTYKKYRMGIIKDTTGAYLNPPAVLNGIGFVGNPDMAADDVIVGDLKQYNIILRGGLIVRVGYNGTDFAENKFSTVIEQYYFDYISTIRKPAIVKGPDFATVKTAIAA